MSKLPVKYTVAAYALQQVESGSLVAATKGSTLPILYPNMDNPVPNATMRYVKIHITVEQMPMSPDEMVQAGKRLISL